MVTHCIPKVIWFPKNASFWLLVSCCCFFFLFAAIKVGNGQSTGSEIATAPAQKSIFILSINVKADFITTDHIGQLYVVVNNKVYKYSGNGDIISTYSNNNLGKITFIDASNPLRILLYYKDFGQIEFLDDVLNPIGSSISLEEMGLDQAVLSCTSWDDGIWLYDSKDFQLKRISKNLKLTHESGPIYQLIKTPVNPNYILEYNNFVYLNNPATGIMVFDLFGSYLKTISIRELKYFQINGNNLFYVDNGFLKGYNLKSFQENSLVLPGSTKDIIGLRFEKESGLFAILKENTLDLFKIQE